MWCYHSYSKISFFLSFLRFHLKSWSIEHNFSSVFFNSWFSSVLLLCGWSCRDSLFNVFLGWMQLHRLRKKLPILQIFDNLRTFLWLHNYMKWPEVRQQDNQNYNLIRLHIAVFSLKTGISTAPTAQQEDGGKSAVEENETWSLEALSIISVPFSSTADSPPSSCCAVGAAEITCLTCF